jgi:PAS domain S-box-containing protein
MQQKSLVLILARDLADKLASAVFVVDHDGTLVYFNETAEDILGRTFADVGEMHMQEWSSAFVPVELAGRPLQPEELPLVVALREQKPSHRAMRIQGMDGSFRDIAVTSLPLFGREKELAGAMAIFWEHETRGGLFGIPDSSRLPGGEG